MTRQALAPHVDPDAANNAARSVLSEAKYLEAARPPSLRERLFEWLIDRVASALEALSSGGGRGLMAWLIVGLFVGLIIFFMARLSAAWSPAVARPRAEGPSIDIDTTRSSAQWLAHAEELERQGDWRRGLRSRYRSLVIELSQRSLVEARPGLTASEIQRQAVDRNPAIATDLAAATGVFESVWYGFRVAGPDTHNEFVGSYDRLMAQLHPADRVTA